MYGNYSCYCAHLLNLFGYSNVTTCRSRVFQSFAHIKYHFCPFIQPNGYININGDHGRHSLYRSIFFLQKINIVDWTGLNNAVEPQQINKQAKCNVNGKLARSMNKICRSMELDVRTRILCGQLKMRKKTRAHNKNASAHCAPLWDSFSYKIWINKYYEHCIIFRATHSDEKENARFFCR